MNTEWEDSFHHGRVECVGLEFPGEDEHAARQWWSARIVRGGWIYHADDTVQGGGPEGGAHVGLRRGAVQVVHWAGMVVYYICTLVCMCVCV